MLTIFSTAPIIPIMPDLNVMYFLLFYITFSLLIINKTTMRGLLFSLRVVPFSGICSSHMLKVKENLFVSYCDRKCNTDINRLNLSRI